MRVVKRPLSHAEHALLAAFTGVMLPVVYLGFLLVSQAFADLTVTGTIIDDETPCSSSVWESGGTYWPDESCTGWEHTGVTLTTYSSPCTISTEGTVIDSKDITCDTLVIRANDVTIKRSRLENFSGTGICNNCDASMVVTGLVVEDVEINCNSVPGSAGIAAENYTARRVNVYECENNLWCNFSCTIEDTYTHDTMYHGTDGCPLEPSPTCHTDAIQMPGGASDVTITHNTILGRYVGGGDFGSAALTSGDGTNLLYEDNILAGAGYSFRFDEDEVGTNTNVQLINNRLSQVFVSTYGGFGPCNGNFNGSGVTSSGNIDHDTEEAIASCN